MAKEIENCPRCDRKVALLPQEGGRGTDALTVYEVHCKCKLHEQNFGWKTGKMQSAIAEWNRFAKAERVRIERTRGDGRGTS